jgi:hypothetical protein
MFNRHNLLAKTVAVAFALGLTGATAPAALLDLGSSGSGFLGGAYFSTTNVQPTGTGVFNPFLSIQNSPSEQGYNSSIGNFDTKREPVWNHEIRLSDLQVTTIGNIGYYGFVVDINEPNGGGKSTISLDGLRIWTSSTLQSSTSTDASGRFNGSLGNLVFDLGGNTLRYDDQQHGSGSGDVNIFIPVSLFANAGPNDYVYMYQFWGNADFSQGGFEETAIRSGVVPIPEVSTFLPILALFAAIGLTQKRRP